MLWGKRRGAQAGEQELAQERGSFLLLRRALGDWTGFSVWGTAWEAIVAESARWQGHIGQVSSDSSGVGCAGRAECLGVQRACPPPRHPEQVLGRAFPLRATCRPQHEVVLQGRGPGVLQSWRWQETVPIRPQRWKGTLASAGRWGLHTWEGGGRPGIRKPQETQA